MMYKNFSEVEMNEFIENFIDHFGVDRIPNPVMYPIQFEFLLKSYEHHLKMKDMKK